MLLGPPGGRVEALAPRAHEARGPRAAAAGQQALCSSPALGSVPRLFLAPRCPSFSRGGLGSPGAVHKCELICRDHACVRQLSG